MKYMFSFGTRQINKQGGSYLISLPIQWLRDCSLNLKEVTIEMDADKNLRIAPVAPSTKSELHMSDGQESPKEFVRRDISLMTCMNCKFVNIPSDCEPCIKCGLLKESWRQKAI